MDRRATLLVAAAVAVLGLAVGLGVAAVDDGGAAPGEGAPDVGVIPGPAPCTERPTVAVTVELADGVTEVRVVRPDGRVEVAAGPVAGQPSFSPDGQRLAVLVADGDFSSSSPPSGVATVGLDGAPPTTVTPIDGGDLFPAWSVTGTIAFLRHDDATRSAWIATVPAEGGEVRSLVEITDPWASVEGLAWAPEGDRLAWLEGVVPSDGSSPTTALRIVDGDGREVRSVALPDPAASSIDWDPSGGRLLLTTSLPDVRPQVVDAATGAVTVLDTPLGDARWSRGGTHVVGVSDAGDVVEAPLEGTRLGPATTILDQDQLGGLFLAGNLASGLAVAPCA